jgi:predicted esterase
MQQLDWWAGERPPSGSRLGQATRHGYIVVSVDWIQRGQVEYQYSAREHAAVLGSLRDACRRFAVDTDRVFLSGHSMGGDAVWDIGLAHPDLWAGVIPIVARADKFVAHYALNAPYMPWYFVGGEFDGDRMFRNARDLDRYMIKPNANVTVVEYLGRGHEHFYEEIQNLFGWMGRHQRNFFPKDFSASSMRSFDNYFWWIELADMPENTLANPADWPPPRGTRAMTTKASVLSSGNVQTVNVQSGAGKITVWLSPELVDFTKRIKITVKGRPAYGVLPSPDLKTLLEDVRTRGDRLHPFWTRVDLGVGVPRAALR